MITWVWVWVWLSGREGGGQGAAPGAAAEMCNYCSCVHGFYQMNYDSYACQKEAI